MKSEERHSLQTNYLADKLGGTIDQVKPVSQWLVTGAVVALVALVGWGLYSSFSRAGTAKAWTQYYFSMNNASPEDFVMVANSHPGSSAALWALQTAGDELLAQGIDSLYRDRKRGEEQISEAIEHFEQVKQKAYQAEIRVRALLGLAQAHESIGELDKAKDYYQQVISENYQTAITNIAATRKAFLETSGGKDFYAWFSTQKPVTSAPPKIDLNSPPSTPDLQFTPPPVDTSKLKLPEANSGTTVPPDGAETPIPTPGKEEPTPIAPENSLRQPAPVGTADPASPAPIAPAPDAPAGEPSANPETPK